MYIREQDLDTIAELAAFVDGALESAEDSLYWLDLSIRLDNFQNRAKKQFQKQEDKRIKNKVFKEFGLNPNGSKINK